MDIVIKNGVINQKETQIYCEKKNELGKYKKDFKDFINGEPGPYYDLHDGHLCIPRMCNKIINFHGPQDPMKIKLERTNNFDKKSYYCSICHKKINRRFSFDPKRKIQEIDYDFLKPKEQEQKVIDNLDKSFKKCKISKEDIKEDDLLNLCDKVNNINLIYWNKIVWKLVENNRIQKLMIYKSKRQKIINNYFILVYKTLYKPIIYNISNYEYKIFLNN